ncbi:YtxH domain-containing protein [Neobacillus sp. SM06]|uniref:YtxH domain-containing protein n=1 Tax=Neobacillus sp. SM06 TaxID=3422492 RepID=UPI003D2B664A
MASREYETRENHQNRTADEKKGGNKFLLGAFIGGIAGAAAGMLLAPKAGKELRSKLNQQLNRLMDQSLQLRGSFVPGKQDIPEDSAPTAYISLEPVKPDHEAAVNEMMDSDEEVQRRLEEAKRALEEEENRISVK